MPLSCAKHLHTYYDRPDKAHPALSEPSPAISGGDPETRPDRPRKVHKAGPRPSQTFCGTFSGSEVPSSSTYTTTREVPENRPDRPRKAQKADPRNKASQTFCGTFPGTKVNPWNHPQILRPAGVRNLDLSAPKSAKSGPPQQSLADVLRNLLRNQSEPLDSSTDTTYDPRGSGIWTFQPRKAQKADPRNKASQTFCGTFSGTKVNPWTHPQILRPAGVRNLDLSAPKSSKSGPPQQSLANVLRNLLRNQSEPLDSSTDTTTRGGPEFGPFSPEKLKKRTPATKPPRRSAEPSLEPK